MISEANAQLVAIYYPTDVMHNLWLIKGSIVAQKYMIALV